MRRQTLIDIENSQLCCPLSFCGSLEHTTVQDCDHPRKMEFIEPIHNRILQMIMNECENIDNEEGPNVFSLLNEIREIYFREPMDEEQLHILLFRLKVPTLLYWNESYEKRIQLVLEAYGKIIHRFLTPVVIEENEEYEMAELDRVFGNETNIIPEEDELSQLVEEWTNDPKSEINILYKGEPTEEMKQQDCPICYETGCFIRVSCSHMFCGECLITYIQKNNGENTKTKCPCCRQEITDLDIYSPAFEGQTYRMI